MSTIEKEKKFWFWAWIVLTTIRVGSKSGKNKNCLIWKNLVLVSGRNAGGAYTNAVRIGRAGESKRGDRVKLDGKPAVTKFLGIAEMGLIHDALKDGCELYFRETRSNLSIAKKGVRLKQKVLRALKQELAPYKRIRWNPHDNERLQTKQSTQGAKKSER